MPHSWPRAVYYPGFGVDGEEPYDFERPWLTAIHLIEMRFMSTDHPASESTSNPELAHSSDVPMDDGDTYRLSSPSRMGGPDDPLEVTPVRPLPRKGPKKPKVNEFWIVCGFNALVFITSICVMMLELTASRLIQKTVGSSLYTWTSVIGVVLAGITLGNFLGGWLADRFDRVRSLAWMYLFGSVACASVLWLDQIIAPISRPSMLSWPTWILTVVTAMFLLPSLALGTISPLVASMALSRSSSMGATVGNVYAWGALGSIIGTFLTGFFLVDVWGTRSIIGLTAGTLGILAAIVAGSQRLFRTAVVCGWLQLLGWTVLAASSTQTAMAGVTETFGTLLTAAQSRSQAIQTRQNWSRFGGELGTKLHELGLLLRLRDDRIGAYHDESSYSTISVTEGDHLGTQVKYLRLDKLIHSYYDPANPTDLHYEYEQVYAAVTKRTAQRLTQPVTLSTKALPGETFADGRVPAGTTYDAETATLRVDQPSQEVFDALLALAPEAGFWKAIEQLYFETNKPLWGGYSFVALDQFPQGLSIPDDLKQRIMVDRSLDRITAYEAVTTEVRDRLIDGTPLKAWYHEVQQARGKSRRATSFFVGGGGFIFPRWFLKEFPGSPRIEVAELDPAVYRVAIEAMGLTSYEQQRITTSIGDARNVVDDRLRDNRQRAVQGQPKISYDFIYGDAFNDFSIPAHLTTYEFLQKIHDLLSDEGVFLANLIDIYPRADFPNQCVGVGEVTYHGPLPVGLDSIPLTFGRYESAGSSFAPLEIKSGGNGDYLLQARRVITPEEQVRLTKVGWPIENPDHLTAWTNAINQLSNETRSPLAFAGTLPRALGNLNTPLEAWRPAMVPWEFVEVCRMGEGLYQVGFRGIISAQQQAELMELDPHNQAWKKAVSECVPATRRPGAGRFLGRYVATAAKVFPNIYLFSTASSHPGKDRDTFVMVCSRRPLDLRQLQDTGDWTGEWFAAMETNDRNEAVMYGQMDVLLTLAEGQILTDDFSPVDNLLRPVVTDQK